MGKARGSDAIRAAAWQGAAATGMLPAAGGTPPLSRAPRPSTRRGSRAVATAPGASGAVRVPPATPRRRATASTEFSALVGEDDDWRDNPFAAASFGERILDLIASGTFEQRDPDAIRESLPLTWLVATLYFRSTIEGLENIPPVGPALLVGNHSGGNYIPDSFILGMAFATYFGAERPWYALTHSAAMAIPGIGHLLRSFGSIPASPKNADEALTRGACVLVYPGGDIETYRPWRERNMIKFAGRMGFVRTALRNRVPLIPVVNVGSHETGIFLSDGQWLCKLLGLDTRFRIKATPIQVGLPWGLWLGDFLPRLLLPAKIQLRVLPEIHFDRTGPDAANDDDYVRECYDRVTSAMQEALTDMASRRRWPIIG